MMELIRRAETYGPRPALRVGDVTFSYWDLLRESARVSRSLLGEAEDLKEARVAYLIPGSFEYVAVQWGIWRAGGIAVPLSVAAREPELEHVFSDAQVDVALVTEEMKPRLEGLSRKMGFSLASVEAVLGVDPPGFSKGGDRPRGVESVPGTAAANEEQDLPAVSPERRALILYTSGTTSKPKGVVSTFSNIEAQIQALVLAWGWRTDDRIPLFLPLHHIHGIVNVLCCALWSGALVEAFPSFNIQQVLDRVSEQAYTIFMAVPTIYVKLIRAFDAAPETLSEEWAAGFRGMRLMISGSAALPAAIHETWTRLTGQKLLERYGMTEIGMGLSNPLEGERRPGTVGQPLPGVELRLVGDDGSSILAEGEAGEIQIRGPAVFQEYWRLPDVTDASFVDGWFRTGDMAVLENGYYRILGRLSVDIINSGGYKLSALEIEDTLRNHPAIREVAVVGMEDELWGESVAAAVVLADGAALDLPGLRDWAGDHLSKYKIPKKLAVLTDFPRNAMGKVKKPAVKGLFVDG